MLRRQAGGIIDIEVYLLLSASVSVDEVDFVPEYSCNMISLFFEVFDFHSSVKPLFLVVHKLGKVICC